MGLRVKSKMDSQSRGARRDDRENIVDAPVDFALLVSDQREPWLLF
jgi:hypothetical protein